MKTGYIYVSEIDFAFLVVVETFSQKKKQHIKTAFTMFEYNVEPLPKDLLQSPTHQHLVTSSFDRNSSQHMCQNRLQRKPASIII